ncbi:hypothetical protein [Polaromonas jejuensis]|uniref:Uncharacterized protein n=1 Tax=Polaromonas jejuensis TaxID=457502 RepID=A0ABW0QCF1_9BURK|nr:hypothetical protein [Polaromonas jejuensis]
MQTALAAIIFIAIERVMINPDFEKYSKRRADHQVNTQQTSAEAAQFKVQAARG